MQEEESGASYVCSGSRRREYVKNVYGGRVSQNLKSQVFF